MELHQSEIILYRDILKISEEEYLARLSKYKLLNKATNLQDIFGAYFYGSYRCIETDWIGYNYFVIIHNFDDSGNFFNVAFKDVKKVVSFNVLYFLNFKRDKDLLLSYFLSLFDNTYKLEKLSEWGRQPELFRRL